jgi:hypothetical protein
MPEYLEEPIKVWHTWRIERFVGTGWKNEGHVCTWSKNRTLAMAKGRIDSPALKTCRIRAVLVSTEQPPSDRMILSNDPKCEDRASYYVFDRNNELGAVRLENQLRASACQ